MTEQTLNALPPIVDRQTRRTADDGLRIREKAATRELDAIAAQRHGLPMVELPDNALIGADGQVRLVDGRSHGPNPDAVAGRTRSAGVSGDTSGEVRR